MITIPLWMQAVDAQLEAVAFCDWFAAQRASPIIGSAPAEIFDGVQHQQAPVKVARPFGWSLDSIRAVIEAAASVPDDTILNRHNLGDAAVFWWFERPLRIPYKTLPEVQALVGSWERQQDTNVFAITLWYRIDATRMFPGHSWEWQEGQSLAEPLAFTKMRGVFTPEVEKSDHAQLLDAVPKVSKFLLAAFAWLNQKILTVTEEHGERHARKRYEKFVKHWHPVLIVHLRKREYQAGEPTSETHASLSYRFVVGGHWRNQPCGPGHSDRKLIYIMPFVKGPEGTPFRPKLKVYEVTR